MDRYQEGMMSEVLDNHFTMFISMFGEKNCGTESLYVIRDAFADSDKEV